MDAMVDATDAAFVRAHPEAAALVEPVVRRRTSER